MSIGQRLKQYIETYYPNGEAFGERVGLDGGKVSNYVTGYRTPSAQYLTAFAAEGMNVNWLLTGEGEMRTADTSHGLDLHRRRDEILIEIEAALLQATKRTRDMRQVI